MPEPQPLSTFGDFRFDSAKLKLSRRGLPVPLSGLPLRILEILLASGGRVVSRSEFKQALWPHALRIDTGRRLNTAMRTLREALGDSGDRPVFIETLRGRGYRWIGAEAPKPARAGSHRPRLAAVFALLLLLFGSQASTAPESSAAELLKTRLALEHWRVQPTPLRRATLEASLDLARTRLGVDPALDTIAADFALAGRWDWAGAERLYRRALSSDPTNSAARSGLAWLLINSGRREAAFREIASLIPLAPLGGDGRAEIGWMLLRLDRPDRALLLCGEEQPHLNLLSCRHTALARLGRLGEAREAAIRLMRLAGASEEQLVEIRTGNTEAGYRRFLDWRAEHFLPPGSSWFQQAQLQADAGQLDDALTSLRRAFAARDPLMVKLRSTPEFRPLARRPQYQRLLLAVGSG